MTSIATFLLCIGALTVTLLSAQTANPKQVIRNGSFELPCSADTAFPLFSPEGERKWISQGWDPQPIFPEHIRFTSNTVFRTQHGEQQAIWTIVTADSTARVADYVYVASARVSRVQVNVYAVDSTHSRVNVRYIVTRVPPAGDEELADFTESAYSQKMEHWRRAITQYLKRSLD